MRSEEEKKGSALRSLFLFPNVFGTGFMVKVLLGRTFIVDCSCACCLIQSTIIYFYLKKSQAKKEYFLLNRAVDDDLP